MNLTSAVETYFSAMRTTHGSGGATKERSYYNALGNLLDAVGGSLKPKVFSVPELAQQGAGHPTSASMLPSRSRMASHERDSSRSAAW